MTLLFLSTCILFLRIVFSVFTGEGGFLIRAVYKLTSYYGLFLICLLVLRTDPGQGGKAISAPVIMVCFLFAAFLIRRSRAVGRALENAMSGVLVTHVFLAILSAAPIGRNAGLCVAACIGFYDLWFLSVIGSEYEYRYDSRVFEIVCGAILLFITSSVCGALIFRLSFYERYGLRNLISIAVCTVMTVYSPAVMVSAFVMEEKNRLVRLNPFFMYKEKKVYRKEREERERERQAADWDYYYKGEKRNSQGRADTGGNKNAGRDEPGHEKSFGSRTHGNDGHGSKEKNNSTGYGSKGGRADSGNYRNSGDTGRGSSYINDELRQAMRVFGLKSISGLTKKELDKKRRELMKRYHPDSGKTGSSDKAGEINAAYDLLKRYTQ